MAMRLFPPLLRLVLGLFAAYALGTLPSIVPRWGASGAGFVLLASWLGLAAMAWPIARGAVKGRRFWLLLGGCAVLPRALALLVVLGHTPIGDPLIYPDLARSLLEGDGLLVHDPLLHTDFRALFPPGYPLFLAVLGAPFGLSTPLIAASNAALDMAAAVLVARIGAVLEAPAAGRAGAWLFAVWPTFILAAPFAQKESLELLLVLGLALLLVRRCVGAESERHEAPLFGALAGLLALVQPGLAFLPATFGVALLPRLGARRLIGLALRAAPAALAVMLPWWVRNALVFGAFVPLTSTAGIGLWIGNNPHATGNWMLLPRGYFGMAELPMSARAAAEAKAWMLAHPIDCLRLTAAKLVRAGGVEQYTLERLALVVPGFPAKGLAALFPLLQGSLVVLLTGAAAFAGRARDAARGDIVLLLLGGCAAQIALFGVWFEYGERHRYFSMPFLFLLAGFALAGLRAPARLHASNVTAAA